MVTCEPASPGQQRKARQGSRAGWVGCAREDLWMWLPRPCRVGSFFPLWLHLDCVPTSAHNVIAAGQHAVRTAVLTQWAPGDSLQAFQPLALVALARNMPCSVVLFPVVPEVAVLMHGLCHRGGDLVVRSKGERFCQIWSRHLCSTPPLSLALSLSRAYCCAKQPS